MSLRSVRPWHCALLAGLLAGWFGCSKSGEQQVAAPSAPAGPGAVPPPAGGNLLKASTFEDGKSLPWMSVFSSPAQGNSEVKDGALCIDIEDVGTNRWDVQVRHREMVIQSGHTYTIQFRAWASKQTKAYPKVGQSGPPYDEYFGKLITLEDYPQVYQAQFTVGHEDDPTAELAIHLGGSLVQGGAPVTVCIDDVYLSDPQFTPPPSEDAAQAPSVRVNQVGYAPKFAKVATVVNEGKSPLEWKLLDAKGEVAASGETTVIGADPHSGDHVHQVDFSAVTAPAEGYVLQVGEDRSDPFDIRADVYSQLKYDALAFFYHNRSGIPIEMPHAREEQWARPAGHKPDEATCAPESVLTQLGWPKGSGCDYTLDVTGGWYDAGDHGKYVVNGGISVWTLFNLYEFQTQFGDAKALGDKTLNIPESGNRRSDLLDEARWQMDFLLKMQVPDGNPLAGMVHHKMHDEEWTALGLAPHEANKKRYLRPPSTAATLNVAATGAQCARVFKAVDAAFAKRCLTAAEKAWKAANENPERYAPRTDTTAGGGPYDDDYVKDEFYWAAAELFTTTGKKAYYDALVANPHHTKALGAAGTESLMTWKETDGLGLITLALAKGPLKPKEREAVRERLVAVADKYLQAVAEEGYRVPFKPKGEAYPWGSNSFIINNMVVLAVVHELTGDKKYLDGVTHGMDYLLGRNPMGQSYVTGYGERPLKNPHHRFWAHQANNAYPSAPPGIVSGGPNSGLEDPYVKAAGLKGCKPQKCFLDHIEAWSANEITINWNAPFAWVAAFLDTKAKQK